MDVARLQIEVDSRQAKVANKNLDNLSRQSRKTERDMGGLSRSSSKTSRAMGTLGRAFGLVAASVGVLGILRIADDMTLLTSRIEQATRSSQEFEEAFRGLSLAARQTGTSLGAAVDVFQRLSFSRDEIGATIDEMVNFTATVQKLGVVSGASTGALTSGLTQLGQGLSSGVLRAEEFNSILENIPAVGQAIADEFGVTVGQLRNLVLEGEVLSEDVFTAILSKTQDVNEQFDKMPLTVGRAFGQLKQDLAIAVQGFNETTQGAQSFAMALQFSGKIVRVLGKGFEAFFSFIQTGFASVSATISGVLEGVAKGVNFIIRQVNRIPGIDFGELSVAQDLEDIRRASFDAAGELSGRAFGSLGEIPSLFRPQEAREQSETTRELTKDYQRLAGAIQETEKASSSASGAIANDNERLRGSFDSLGESFGNTFARFVNGTLDARSALRSFVNDLQGALFNKASSGIASTLLSSISGITSGFFGATAQSTGRSIPSIALASAQGKFGPGFATGGSFTVGGTGGTDSQQVSFRATPGEMINIKRPGQSDSGGVVYNIDARGAEQGVEQKIRQVLSQVQRLRSDVPGIATSAVRDENSRNPRFLRNG